MRILVVSDVQKPTINGLVRVLAALSKGVRERGHELFVISPNLVPTLPIPPFPDVRLGMATPGHVGRLIAAYRPDVLHICSEGPMALSARLWATSSGQPFFSAVHTRMDLFVKASVGIPASWTNRYMEWFHRPSWRILVNSDSQMERLGGLGWGNLQRWHLGVDQKRFRPPPRGNGGLKLPHGLQPNQYLLWAGRVSVEKNVQAFLRMEHPLRKVVAGDGAKLAEYRKRYPDVLFLGMQHGEDLVRVMQGAAALAFSSLTDTLGLVILEALSCGTPVAGFPVAGPRDLIEDGVTGGLDEDLGKAVQKALGVDRSLCQPAVERYSWQRATEEFLDTARQAPRLRWDG